MLLRAVSKRLRAAWCNRKICRTIKHRMTTITRAVSPAAIARSLVCSRQSANASAMVVVATTAIDHVDQRGQRRSLAAARRAGEQDQSLAPLRELGQYRRQMQRLERRDLRGQNADAGRERPALIVKIGPEPADRAPHETKIQRLVGL